MSSSVQRLISWVLALISLVLLPVSAMLVIMNPAGQDTRYLEILSGAIIGCGAPILGLVILRQQPRNRIGWLWLVIGLSITFFSLSYALKYQANSAPPAGYSTMLFSMLLFSETAYIVRFICMTLLMLWFPAGQPPSPRWRFMYWWAALAFMLLTVGLFAERIHWSGIEGIIGGAPLIDNPVGFLPVHLTALYDVLSTIGFLSILVMMIAAAISIVIRYRSATQQVRTQIQWFVLGSILYAASFVASIFIINFQNELPGILGNLAIIPFYLAIGIAITRYHLYDIDVIIRKTLVYGALTATLGLVFFGGVTLLQQVFGRLSGTESSPIAIVLSTLTIAALSAPLRRRVQDFIDRRFYRKKYNAEQALAEFAAAARSETEMDSLTGMMLRVADESLQPEFSKLWLVKRKDR